MPLPRESYSREIRSKNQSVMKTPWQECSEVARSYSSAPAYSNYRSPYHSLGRSDSTKLRHSSIHCYMRIASLESVGRGMDLEVKEIMGFSSSWEVFVPLSFHWHSVCFPLYQGDLFVLYPRHLISSAKFIISSVISLQHTSRRLPWKGFASAWIVIKVITCCHDQRQSKSNGTLFFSQVAGRKINFVTGSVSTTLCDKWLSMIQPMTSLWLSKIFQRTKSFL